MKLTTRTVAHNSVAQTLQVYADKKTKWGLEPRHESGWDQERPII